MKRIGILSDTHGTFDDTLRRFFDPVEELWHAGDIGSAATFRAIEAFRPLRAVWGNIDGNDVRVLCPQWTSFACEEVRVLMTHIGGYPGHYAPGVVPRLATERPTLFIAGHSHILKVIFDKKFNLMHINPGASGHYGFHRVRTAVRLAVDGARLCELEVGEWPR